MFKLICSCGWKHECSSRHSATLWKRMHREEHQQPGQRLSEGGHDVQIVKTEKATATA